MPPRSSDHDRPQTKFMFVGGPSFNAHRSGNLRSTLLRRVLSERRVKRRQDAADKLDHILKGQGDPPAFCSCAQESESSAEASGYRPIKPRNEQSLDPARGSDTGRDGCSTCGGLLPPSAPASRGQASRVPSPQPLGTGSYDPLLPVDPVASGLKVQELLHFAVTVIWPHFRPLSYAGDCYHSWVFPVENNVQLYAILWASSYHRDVLRVTYGREPQLDSKEQLQLKGLALKSLQAELANISGSSPLDGVVMCVLYLAVNERYMTKVFRDPSPFCPPFQNLHALDFYGSRDYHPLHWNVVQDIIQRFGGIEVLQAFALAWLVSISGLMNAIHTLQKPVYPILGVDGKRLDLPPPLLLFHLDRGRFPHDTPGLGFYELLHIWPPVRQQIVSVFIHIGEFSQVIQFYSEKTCSPAVLDLMGDTRNLVHHRLFSLPDENDRLELILDCGGRSSGETELSREIYLACRLGVILYAIHVTYPVPRSQGLRDSILQRLHPKIDRLMNEQVPGRLLLWCVTIAVIAMGDGASNSPNQLTMYMRRLCHNLSVNSLPKLMGLLHTFVWVDGVVPDHCEGLWRRISSL